MPLEEIVIRTCRHVMPTGRTCQSPAMRESAYCYFHAPSTRHFRRAQQKLKLPALDRPRAIQEAIPSVLNQMLARKIDSRQAGRMLYGIQMASDQLNGERKASLSQANVLVAFLPKTSQPSRPVGKQLCANVGQNQQTAIRKVAS